MSQKPRKTSQKPARGIYWAKEGRYGEEEAKGLQARIAAVANEERFRARERQYAAGITQPVKTDFKIENDPELKSAMQKIWDSGLHGRILYIRASKGLVTMTREDVLALARYSMTQIDGWASMLASGWTLAKTLEQPKS